MEKAIKKAIEGGYKIDDYYYGRNGFYPDHVLLDPLFWQALGWAEGWKDSEQFETRIMKCTCSKCGDSRVTIQWAVWRYHWHRFIDHLAEGKDVESFFNELLK